jgi:hypothetical protein
MLKKLDIIWIVSPFSREELMYLLDNSKTKEEQNSCFE